MWMFIVVFRSYSSLRESLRLDPRIIHNDMMIYEANNIFIFFIIVDV